MGNPTNVYFYREDVMLAKEVSVQSSGAHFSVSFEVFINACVAQAHHYARVGQRDRVFDILYIAEEHIFPEYSSRKNAKSHNLILDGVKAITTFEKSAVFEDIKKIISKTSSFLQDDLYTWVRCTGPRFPRSHNTLFRLLVRSIARPGMFFFD